MRQMRHFQRIVLDHENQEFRTGKAIAKWGAGARFGIGSRERFTPEYIDASAPAAADSRGQEPA
jgi:hypothetical protein